MCLLYSSSAPTSERRHFGIVMDLDSNTEICCCGKSYLQSGSLRKHQRSCKKSNKQLGGAMVKAKGVWEDRKRRRIDKSGRSVDIRVTEADATINADGFDAVEDPSTGTYDTNVEAFQTSLPCPDEPLSSLAENDDHLSLAERRVRRQVLQPVQFRDILPQPLLLLPPVPEIPIELPPRISPPSPSVPLQSTTLSRPTSQSQPSRVVQNFRSPRNVFGLLRQYRSDKSPSHDPEEHISLHDLSEDPATADATTPKSKNPFHPFPNKNSFLLGDWYWNGSIQKSRESFRELLRVVGNPDFHPEDVSHTKWNKIDAKLARNDFDRGDGANEEGEAEWMDEDAGWKRSSIKISVPFHSRTKIPGPQDYHVGHLYHRSLVSVIREKIANPLDNQHFHYDPFELFWRPTNTNPDVRVHGELYTSPAFLDAHRELQESPGEPGCSLQKVVVAMMFSSDATHLTSFGPSKIWPCYLFFGNESKYRRCQPTNHLCNHVAYFQSLPDAFKDFTSQNMSKHRPSQALMTHCRRELLHKQWEILLDEEFLVAYEHGIVIECCDSIMRRFYPRIVTYSADYKEKVIVGSIRDLGLCPCPRCLIPLSRVHNMGMVLDMKQRVTLARVDDAGRRRKVDKARDLIYKSNCAVDSDRVEEKLQGESLVPTHNAFSQKLAAFGFNLFLMLVVDIMHEFELGVWKALFIHLLRILNAKDKTLVDELDRQMVPTFGRDTIRRFSSNVSEMKKLAARDFENLLQCAIPVFDGLLPEPHNGAILKLLFVCAHWHALGKLRMHTDISLNIFDKTTVGISTEVRKFTNKTCAAFDTRELNRETEARKRRQQSTNEAVGSDVVPNRFGTSSTVGAGPQRKKFSLRTYKYHSLGDYAATIRRFGTTDSYSTEPGELEHCTSKARYKRTDRKQIVKQLAQIERREFRLRRIKDRLSSTSPHLFETVATSPQEHHHIGVSQNQYEHIGTFLRKNSGDPAIKGFLPMLKQHLLTRILREGGSLHDQSTCSPDSVLFKHDRLYKHNIIRINYTTYDIRRSQDVLNPSTSHCNLMVLTSCDGDQGSDAHPFRYARVLRVYHANVVYVGPGSTDYQPRRMEFLWVRWYRQLDIGHTGWAAQKLDRLQFPPVAEEDSFGFIDPSEILRGCHIIPAFAKRKLHRDGKGLSICARDSSDWVAYYVDRFVDRDMVMRYHYGLGVGHTYSHSASSQSAEHHLERDLPENEGLNGNDSLDFAEGDREESEDDQEDDPEDSELEEPDYSDDDELFAMEEMYGL